MSFFQQCNKSESPNFFKRAQPYIPMHESSREIIIMFVPYNTEIEIILWSQEHYGSVLH